MACLRVFIQVLLLVFWPVQLSSGDLAKLRKFSAEPVNYLEIDLEDGLPSPQHKTHLPEQGSPMSKREAAGVPHIDGEYHFNDGYHQGRVRYTGSNSDEIVVLTYDTRADVSFRSNLYRSTDYGHTFTNINDRVQNATLYQKFFYKGNMLIFAHTSEPKIFYTLDGGAHFTTVDLVPNNLNTHTIEYHPSRDGWMMMLSDDNALFVTTNFGKTWTAVASNVVNYHWGDDKWDTSNKRIYYTSQDPNQGLLLYKSDHPYTNESLFDPELGDHDTFQLVGRYMFVQHTDSSGVVSLYVSDQRKPFEKALIPSSLPHQSYLVTTHIDEMQAMVIVEHQGGFYNLYLSDDSGIYYTLSLSDIVVDSQPQTQIDLEVIEGVNGTLIANQYLREDRSSLIRTVISLDNGGYWEPLHPPSEDVNGNPVECEPPECSLHLHIDTTSFSRLGVYSTASAPGIIVAHGNLGDRLNNNPDLYISRNGGVDWKEILAGSWGVNVADHGGLIVAAKDYHQEQSRVLKYSCDEGSTWNDFTFIGSNFTVFGVITEPGENTTVVSLYGGPWERRVRFTWTVVTVDFADIFPRECEEEDYYDWRPWDDRSDTDCILGSTITVERRMANACCLNGRNYEREFNFEICDCAIDDFECDYGFARPSHDFNAPCVRDRSVFLPNPCADGKTETYMASTGYRKIPGDVCKDGEEHLFRHFKAPCCGNTTLPPALYNPSPDTPSPDTPSPSPDTPSPDTPSPDTPSPDTPSPDTQSPDTPSPDTPSPDTPSPSPDTHDQKDSSDEEGFSASVVGGMGLLLVVLCAVIILLLIVFVMKYRAMRRKYIRVVTAGEPELLTYSAATLGREADELTPGFDGDDDDKPLVP